VDLDNAKFNIQVVNLDGLTRVVISGTVDETAVFTSMGSLAGPVEVDLRKIRRINSFGVRGWIDAMRNVPSSAEMTFVHIPPAIVEQMNMLPGFLGAGKVINFYAPMICDECDEEGKFLFDADECRKLGHLPKRSCTVCAGEMELDEIEEQYTLFLRV